MTAPRPITVVGGGLAGLTLGIGLRHRNVPVTVFESGSYPRHRVCGEFICGEGQKVLERLELRRLFDNAGGIPAQTVTFLSARNRSPVRRLNAPALCLSRYSMDSLLAQEFQRLGGDLRENTRWPKEANAEGVVHANGRRAQPTEKGWRWFGLKAHARNIELTADLEMHVSPTSYVGINRTSGGEVNVCGLFRARPGETKTGTGLQLLHGEPGSPLFERMSNARFDENSFCSVAGLSLKPQHAEGKTECRIGDSLTMIPPVTGNGMSMAFESAEMAVGPLEAYSCGALSWAEAQKTIARACDAAFGTRLAWARILQWLMFSPLMQTAAGAVLLQSELLWRTLFNRTR